MHKLMLQTIGILTNHYLQKCREKTLVAVFHFHANRCLVVQIINNGKILFPEQNIAFQYLKV